MQWVFVIGVLVIAGAGVVIVTKGLSDAANTVAGGVSAGIGDAENKVATGTAVALGIVAIGVGASMIVKAKAA